MEFKVLNNVKDIMTFTAKIRKMNNEVLHRFLVKEGLLVYHLKFFFMVAVNDGITAKEITKSLQIDKANTTRAIQKLIKKGWVTKDIKIVRNSPIVLTKKGEEIAKLFDQKIYQMKENIISTVLTEEEQKQLLYIMDKIELFIN